MIPMTTRRPRIAFWACLLTGALTGCDDSNIDGGSSSCTDDFKPLNPVTSTMESFRVGEPDNPNNSNVELTLFRQYFQAIKPEDGTDNAEDGSTVAGLVEEISEPLVNFQGGFPMYESTRNAFDLIEAMIVSGEHQPLRTAREAMASCIEEGEAGGIQVPGVTVTEKPDGDSDEEKESETWQFPRLTYNHNPTPLQGQTGFGANVSRGIMLENGFLLSLYEIDQFSGINRTSGYKSPGEVTLALNPGVDLENDSNDENEPPSLLFVSGLRDQTDRWSWSLPDGDETLVVKFEDGSEFEGSCLRVTRDYGKAENNVTVELSEASCPAINSAQEQRDWQPNREFRYTGLRDVTQRADR